MPMNITIDDPTGELAYTSGWREQPSPAPGFFQGTYHGSQSANENMTVTFNGTAIYIYGSKGPNYGEFKTQCDNLVTFNTSAISSSQVEYQQLLYANVVTPGTHFLQLTTTSNKWVDIDFIVLTIAGPDNDPDPGSFSTTVSANPVPSSQTSLSSQTVSSPDTPLQTSFSPASKNSSSSSSSSTVTKALTGVFGGLLALVLLALLSYYLLKRHRKKQYEKERAFRRGENPYAAAAAGVPFGTSRGSDAGAGSRLGRSTLGSSAGPSSVLGASTMTIGRGGAASPQSAPTGKKKGFFGMGNVHLPLLGGGSSAEQTDSRFSGSSSTAGGRATSSADNYNYQFPSTTASVNFSGGGSGGPRGTGGRSNTPMSLGSNSSLGLGPAMGVRSGYAAVNNAMGLGPPAVYNNPNHARQGQGQAQAQAQGQGYYSGHRNSVDFLSVRS